MNTLETDPLVKFTRKYTPLPCWAIFSSVRPNGLDSYDILLRRRPSCEAQRSNASRTRPRQLLRPILSHQLKLLGSGSSNQVLRTFRRPLITVNELMGGAFRMRSWLEHRASRETVHSVSIPRLRCYLTTHIAHRFMINVDWNQLTWPRTLTRASVNREHA